MGPIAHGFLTLSLLPRFLESALEVVEARMGVNYGLNRVRFISPVPVGGRLRGRIKLAACEPIDNQGMQMTWDVTIEIEGAGKPACVGRIDRAPLSLSRWAPRAPTHIGVPRSP